MSDPVSKEADKVPEDDAWGCPLASPCAHTCIHLSVQSNNTSNKDGVICSLCVDPGRTSSKPAQALGVTISPANIKEHTCLLVPLKSQLLLCWKTGAPIRTSTSLYALNLPRRPIHTPVCLSSLSVSTEGLLLHTEIQPLKWSIVLLSKASILRIMAASHFLSALDGELL